MRIPSAKVDQNIYFVAFDSTDHVTRKTGLSSFTVQRSRNGAAEVAYTTPTVSEIDSSTMPGVYALLIDEDTTIAANSDSEEMALHITATGMDPVTRTIELYRPADSVLFDRAAGVETGLTLRQALRLMSSVLFGKASGMATGTGVFRDFPDTKARVTATQDADGNRTAVTTDAT